MAARGHTRGIGQLPEPITATAQSMHEGCQSRSRYTKPTSLCFFTVDDHAVLLLSHPLLSFTMVSGPGSRLPKGWSTFCALVVSEAEAIMKPALM